MLAASLALLVAAWLILHWAILPHIQQWRGPIEARAARLLGVPLALGGIEVRPGGWWPALVLRDVVLADAAGHPALRLPRIDATLSARSLAALDWRFDQVVIDGAELDVRRDAAGRIRVAGLDFSGAGGAGADFDAADWFFKQPEFVVRHGTLRWTDEQRGAPPLALVDVQLVVRNGLRSHDIRLDATPPAAWGERFQVVGRFTQPLLAPRGGWRRWSGSAYVDLPRADVRGLGRYLTLPFELSRGDGALRGWFDIDDGRPTGATLDLALRAVTLRLAPKVDPLELEQIEGRVVAQRRADASSLALQRFGFRTGDAVQWPASDMRLTWRQAEGEPARGGEFDAERLDLGLMARIAARLPLGDALRQGLAPLDLQGVANGLVARWDGPLDAPQHYRARAALTGLTLRGRSAADGRGAGVPGVRRADLTFDADERGGSAQLGVTAGAIELPGVFDDPLVPLDRLSAWLAWQVEPAVARAKTDAMAPVPAFPPAPQITLRVEGARFANADAEGAFDATWRTGPGAGFGPDGRYPGRLVLDGTLASPVAERTARYLPLDLSSGIRRYIERAVGGGRISAARFHVDGRLANFPFDPARRKEGEFRIEAQLADLSFAYVPAEPGAEGRTPGWPALTHADGELVIDRASLDIRNGRAQLGGAQWSQIQGGIKNLARPVLQIDAKGRGPLSEMLRFVNTTPIGTWTGHALAEASVTGAADLQLGLTVPLDAPDGARVKGSLALAGNDLRIAPDSPFLGAARGRVDFSEKGFAVVGATARVVGGEAAFEGGSQADGSLRFTGQGVASAEGLRHAPELGDLARAAVMLDGQAAYQLRWGLVHGRSEMQLTSNLVGLASSLPAPLAKAADAPLALRWQTALAAEPPGAAGSGAVPTRDTLRVELGSLLQAHYQRDLSGDAARVLRGGIGVMEPAPQPAAGVAAAITLPALDVEAWQAAFDKLAGAGSGGSAAAAAAGAPGGAAAAAGTTSAAGDAHAGGYAPDSVALRVQTLAAGSRRLDRLVAGVSRSAGVWRANVASDQLDGYVEFRPAGAAAVSGGVYARLARLSLPKTDADPVESLLDEAPTRMPALDVVVDDFELRGKRLGRLEVEALNRVAGSGRDAAREWQLSKLNLTLPEARLTAQGSWSAAGGQPLAGGGAGNPAQRGAARRRSVLDFKLAVDDSGALLARLGTPRAIKGGRGQLSGTVAWLGSPMALDYPSLAGKVHVAIDSGQFLKAEPGAARLLGVLSLQALPRRFALDFRDLFQEGFAFDNVTGDIVIDQGEARTNNLRMRGVQAVVLMDGRADIARETQDLRVWVVPEINAGTASLAYAVINPAIGLGTFLAQVVLRKQLVQAGTREFHVHGPWDDPAVDPVERKLTDAVPTFDPPYAGPAASAAAAPSPPSASEPEKKPP